MKLTFDIKNQIITRTDIYRVIANSADYIEAEFSFSADWDGLVKTASFANGNVVITVPLDNNAITAEKHLNLGVGTWKVSVEGVLSEQRIVTNSANVTVRTSGSIEHTGPTADVYQQLLVIISELQAEAVPQALINSAVEEFIDANYQTVIEQSITATEEQFRVIMENISEDYKDTLEALLVEIERVRDTLPTDYSQLSANVALLNTTTIKSVNNLRPDANGNVNVDGLSAVDDVARNGVDNLAVEIDSNSANFLQNKLESVEAYTVYVSKTGDDANSGASFAPVKTLNRAFEIASKKYMDARIEIVSSGAYDVDTFTNSGNIHITAKAENVVLNLARNFINYACHINIKGLANSPIVVNGNGFMWYNDGCAIEFNHVDLNVDLRLYGGNVNFTENCIVRNLTALSVAVYFGKDVKFKNTIVNRPALQLTNASVYFAYTWSVELNGDDPRDFLFAYGCTFTCTPAPNVSGGRYARNVMNLGTYISSASGYNGIKALANTNTFGTAIISNITL